MGYPNALGTSERGKEIISSQADLELAKRSVPSAFFQFALLLLVAIFSPYRGEHPWIIAVSASVLLAVGAGRFAVGLRFASKYAHNPRRWRRVLRIGAYAAAISWSVFSCVSLWIYSHEWVSWLVLLVTAGIAAGASTALSPDYVVSSTYTVLLLGPSICTMIVSGGLGSYSTPLIVTLYMVFLLIQGREQYRSYREAIRVNLLLDERGAYLNALTEESPLAIAVADRERRLQMCNRAFERLFQFEQEELMGKKLSDVFRSAESEVAQFNLLAESDKPVNLTTRRPRKDGVLIDVEIHAVPLMLKGKMDGLLVLFQDITDRKNAEEELKRRSAEISLLSEMASLLQSCQSVDEASEVIRVTAHRLLPDCAGSLAIMKSSANLVETVAVWGETYSGERVFAPDDCWALRRGQVHKFAADVSATRCRHTASADLAASLCVPLLGQGEVLGILHLQVANTSGVGQKAQVDLGSQAEQELTGVLAEQVALSLASLKLREKLRNQSIRDPLTGLFNRRYMEESLERELSRAVRTKTSIALIMVDIDHFKRFNDTFGHLGGDALLRGFGEFLSRRTRKQDVVCRFGGEEFALVLTGSNLEGAISRAEVLRQEVKELQVQHAGHLLGKVTLSMGVVAFPAQASTIQEMFQFADRALYAAKEAGRDRVVAAATPKTAGSAPDRRT